jgi:hypothetical protein
VNLQDNPLPIIYINSKNQTYLSLQALRKDQARKNPGALGNAHTIDTSFCVDFLPPELSIR